MQEKYLQQCTFLFRTKIKGAINAIMYVTKEKDDLCFHSSFIEIQIFNQYCYSEARKNYFCF